MAAMSRHKARRKGGARERVFGCDLLQLLQRSGQAVPQVLRSCTEFVEQHGVVDGIYRLSGVASNIQRLRQEFESERCPDLHRDVYLQDIHCVSSLCKAYCRELPNPLLTYQLYHKFADAVSIQMEDARLVKIKEVLKELPAPHYRTLEFLMRHLLRMAAHSSRTNMHARNLAIVWAPNLLRSKDIEASAFNGTAAFMEVRVQSIVVEFILTHVEQLFGDAPLQGTAHGAQGGGQWGGQWGGMGTVTPVLWQATAPPPIRPYHTIIELSEHRRKGSLKSRNWRSLFHLGRSSLEAKRKGKALEHREDTGGARSLRPAKSMDSLSTVPSNGDGEGMGSCPVPPGRCREPAEGREEPPGDGSARSEPGTPRAGPRRPPRCPGLHISVPFSVTVPLHITANLSRLTRGLPCPALGTGALGTGPVPVLPVLPEPVPVLPEPVLPEPVPVLPVLPEPVLPEPVPVSVLPEPELPVPVLPEPVPVLPEPELPVPVLPVPVPVLPEPVLPEPVLPEPVPVLPVLPEPEPVLPMPVLPVPVLPEPVPVLPEPVPVLPELPVPVLPEPVPVLPEPAAGLRLATPAAPVLQARSVPVVPPKPQFARAPPEPVPPLAARPPLRRPRWSRSLDAEQAPGRAPLRRSRTYGEDPGPTEPGGCGAAPRRALGPGEEQ
uniref:Uncharacterized protein n=1 Tax=Melopsittacus undulatus TaxID=13146 RepID=A0A8V5H2J7_MELUD